MELVGDSLATESLKRRGVYLARSEAPIWVYGAPGSGKSHLAEWLYSLHPVGQYYRISGEGLAGTVVDRIRQTPNGCTVHLDTLAHRVVSTVGLKLAEICMEGTRRILIESLYSPEKCAELSVAMGAVAEIMPVKILPLNDRGPDIPALALYFATELEKKITKGAIETLSRVNWVDNVRGLKKAVEDGASRARKEITPKNLAPEFQLEKKHSFITLDLPELTVDAAMMAVVKKALEMTNHNVSAASRMIGKSCPWIYSRVDQFGLSLRLPSQNMKKGPGKRGKKGPRK